MHPPQNNSLVTCSSANKHDRSTCRAPALLTPLIHNTTPAPRHPLSTKSCCNKHHAVTSIHQTHCSNQPPPTINYSPSEGCHQHIPRCCGHERLDEAHGAQAGGHDAQVLVPDLCKGGVDCAGAAHQAHVARSCATRLAPLRTSQQEEGDGQCAKHGHQAAILPQGRDKECCRQHRKTACSGRRLKKKTSTHETGAVMGIFSSTVVHCLPAMILQRWYCWC